ncbi:hypothetical protein R69776_03895 [Paraburkholderia nemoris]|uniref:Lipoprotein n=2 Tax=Paraburkholderia nemoris TaxID=2793076 RepID=A0ABN7LZ98_9BURK|nr:hypothetical protein R69776_03895 [Paraburkholderia nemoris]
MKYFEGRALHADDTAALVQLIRAAAGQLRIRGLPDGRQGECAAQRRIMSPFSHSEAARRGSHLNMTLSIRSPLLRRVAVVALVFGGLTACQKNDASAQVAGKLNDAAQAAGQKLDQAASYVGQQVDATKAAAQQNLSSASAPSITIDPASLASSAQANLQGAASATNAQLGKAAALTGQGLETAGRKLQEWSAQSSASAAGVSASASTSSDSSDAQKQMDK